MLIYQRIIVYCLWFFSRCSCLNFKLLIFSIHPRIFFYDSFHVPSKRFWFFKVLHLPGHSTGSIALHCSSRQSQHALFYPLWIDFGDKYPENWDGPDSTTARLILIMFCCDINCCIEYKKKIQQSYMFQILALYWRRALQGWPYWLVLPTHYFSVITSFV